MSVKIRLQRHGKKGKPFYWIVAADARAKRDGRYLQKLGTYNPNTNPATINLDIDKSVKWLQFGAQPTDTARNILSYKGALMKNHLKNGVRKGALTEEQVEEKFEQWLNEKSSSIDSKKSSLEKETQLQKQLFQKLVKLGSLTDDYPLEVVKSKIPKKFKKLTLAEVRNLSPDYNEHLLDLSNLKTYTIDDANTKDKDDAFSLDETTLWIHITDLTNIVKINSELDKEAFNRTSSLYMPDGIIPMLPMGISEQIGSLNKNKLRQCISLKLTTNENCEVINTSFHRTLIKSDKSISYKEAEFILDDKTILFIKY